jgi:hypothetical protein
LADNHLRVHVAGLEEARLIESMQMIASRIHVRRCGADHGHPAGSTKLTCPAR